MKKRLLITFLIIVTVLTVSILLCSCNDEPAPTPSESESESGYDSEYESESSSATESDTEAPPPVQEDASVAVDGQAKYKVVRAENASAEEIACATAVFNALNESTGLSFEFTDDYVIDGSDDAQNSYEILIGLTGRDASKRAFSNITYGEWLVQLDGNKIVIAAYGIVPLEAACNEFVQYVKDNASAGNLTVAADYTRTGSTNELLSILPYYTAADTNSVTTETYIADQNYMVSVSDTTKDEYEEYLKQIEGNGFKEFKRRDINGSVFAIYTTEKHVINAQFYKNDNTARIIVEDQFDMSMFEKQSYEKVCDAALTMVGCAIPLNETDISQIGLCLIFTLEDGRLIVVDGGSYYTSMSKILKENLQAASPDPENVRIAAWIFTHPHQDHSGAFNKLVEREDTGFISSLENVIYNFPIWDVYASVKDPGQVMKTRENITKAFPNANLIKAHPGNVYYFADVELEMLYSYDAMLPFALDGHNTTSLAFRVKTNGQSVIILGDVTPKASRTICDIYRNHLSSDMVNVSHHGLTGASTALYGYIDADVVLWTSGAEVYNDYKSKSYNVRMLQIASEIYVADDEITKFTFPHTVTKK